MLFAIIAAGKGSRLKQEGVELPKPLIRIGNEPMIYGLIQTAIRNGASSIAVIINENSPQLYDYLHSLQLDIPLHLIIKSTPSSMHSLFALQPALKGDAFFLTTTDSIFKDEEFKAFKNYCEAQSDLDGVLAVTGFVDDENPLSVRITAERRIIAFEDGMCGNRFVTGGLYYFKSKIFNETDSVLASGTKRLRNFLRHLLKANYQLYAYPFTKMIDVDHVADIEQAEQFLSAAAVEAEQNEQEVR